MKKTWKFLLPIIVGIIILAFLIYLLIPMLTGIVTVAVVAIIIVGLILLIKKFFGN